MTSPIVKIKFIFEKYIPMAFGAIVGDYYGSNYEFSCYPSEKAPSLKSADFSHGDYTDDSVMTIAVMDALINEKDVAQTLREYGRKYRLPKGGYGGMFARWLRDPSMGPYGSYGNGAAMRISGVGLYASSEEECIALSKKVTEITHNHPEGIKGAEVTALCIYKAMHGASKEELKEYISKNYDIDFDLKDLHQNYRHEASCQKSVPQALYCFISSSSFRDCLRRVCYIGGDADTTGAIACAIAAAYYKKIPHDLLDPIIDRMPSNLKDVLYDFALHLLLKNKKEK